MGYRGYGPDLREAWFAPPPGIHHRDREWRAACDEVAALSGESIAWQWYRTKYRCCIPPPRTSRPLPHRHPPTFSDVLASTPHATRNGDIDRLLDEALNVSRPAPLAAVVVAS